MLQNYCKRYREQKGVLLRELTRGQQIKTLSAFESGRSTNIGHFEKYVRLSILMGDYQGFMDGLLKELANSDSK